MQSESVQVGGMWQTKRPLATKEIAIMSIEAVVYVVGLGPGDPLDLPARNMSMMRSDCPVYLRTEQHPVVPYLEREGIKVQALDHFYEEYDSFEKVYSAMTAFLLQEAQKESALVFAVPGSPLVGEAVVRLLKEEGPNQGVDIKILPAPGFLDTLYQLLEIDPSDGLLITDSFQLLGDVEGEPVFSFGIGIIVMQLYSSDIASEVKLTLMESYPDDHQVIVVRSAGIRGSESLTKIPLYELDRQRIDHLTTLYVPPLSAGEQLPSYGLDSLLGVMDNLLSPNGCPWDRQQTHQTLKKYLIEETYEVIDAIDEEDMHKLCEELGDLLLQIVFHAALAERAGKFGIEQVISGITKKMIHRHPHVFGGTKVEEAAQVVELWEAIKQKEGEPKSLLAGVPSCLPALQKAQKVQTKAALVGFDWPEAAEAALKVEEEWREVQSAWKNGDRAELQRELGDFFFATVNTCRLLKLDAEETLRAAVDKFMRRFSFMEVRAKELSVPLAEMSLGQLNDLWDEAKSNESKK
jgi:tetrapyrrole methylase family protein/MazG family protein